MIAIHEFATYTWVEAVDPSERELNDIINKYQLPKKSLKITYLIAMNNPVLLMMICRTSASWSFEQWDQLQKVTQPQYQSF